jgi:hypothetical protein
MFPAAHAISASTAKLGRPYTGAGPPEENFTFGDLKPCPRSDESWHAAMLLAFAAFGRLQLLPQPCDDDRLDNYCLKD